MVYITNFFKDKPTFKTWQIKSKKGITHKINNLEVIDKIKETKGQERQQIMILLARLSSEEQDINLLLHQFAKALVDKR